MREPVSSTSISLASFRSSGGEDRASDAETVLTSGDYEEQPPAADPLLGMVVAGRYRIRRQLGAGGMGVVYEVEHIDIGKLLAMKLLTGELGTSADVVRRFKREALAASKLHSPNAVQVFDFGVTGGLTYLVMELVQGETLTRLLRREGPMKSARLAKIVIQICNALSEAHRKGIVHRDVKPDNVMILRTPDGAEIVKVLDFGLAKLREPESEEVSSRGMVLGTPHYMAPEQIRSDAVDGRSDIYSLGALMYLALTGAHPFQGKATDVLLQHLTAYPLPPEERAPARGIGASMSAIVMRALRKDPSDRFASVEQLQHHLVEEAKAAGSSSVESLLDSEFMQRLANAAEPTRAEPRVALRAATRNDVDGYERKLKRRRFVSGGAFALGLLGLAGGALAMVLTRDRAPAPRVEREPNDTPAAATPLEVGATLSAFLGKRLDATHADRDFYAFEIAPTGAPRETLEVKVSGLPNAAMCTFIFRRGFSEPLSQLCPGRRGEDLATGPLELGPGAYFLEVTQDEDGYGQERPLVVENVSDPYTVLVDRVAPASGAEVEPNDDVRSARALALGASVTGRIAWNRDEDVYCVRGDGRPFMFRLATSPAERGVLEAEVSPGSTSEAMTTARVRAPSPALDEEDRPRPSKPPAGAVTESPWVSAPISLATGSTACIRVKLVKDPEAPSAGPTGTSAPYTVSAQLSP